MCRLAYELAQARHGTGHRFKSIDKNYFVVGEGLVGRVTHNHIPIRQNEINATQGDVVRFLGNHWDGYVQVNNPKSKQTGLIPAFKIERIFKTHNYSSKIIT